MVVALSLFFHLVIDCASLSRVSPSSCRTFLCAQLLLWNTLELNIVKQSCSAFTTPELLALVGQGKNAMVQMNTGDVEEGDGCKCVGREDVSSLALHLSVFNIHAVPVFWFSPSTDSSEEEDMSDEE